MTVQKITKNMARGRKSRYNPDLVESIIDMIAKTGRDVDGMKVGGISSNTFYEWCNKYPDFKKKVAAAKERYREVCPEELKRKAQTRLMEYLDGTAEEVWKKHIEIKDKEGEIIRIEDHETRVSRPCPQWVIRRILGEQMSFMQAINTLANEDMLPDFIVDKAIKHVESLQSELQGLKIAPIDVEVTRSSTIQEPPGQLVPT